MIELPATTGAEPGIEPCAPVAEITRVDVWDPYYGQFVRLPDIRITDIS